MRGLMAVLLFAGVSLVAGASSAFAAGASHDCTVKHGVVYSRTGSRDLKLDLCLPKTAEHPRPAVVLIHGGSWLFGTRHQLHWYGRKLAENGYVTADITYRMMPKYGFPYCLYDCKAAVRWLRAHAAEYNIDPDRIVAMGDSAGGHLAAMLATTAPKDGLEGPDNMPGSAAVQAAIILYGVTDLNYYRMPEGYLRFLGFAQKFVRKFVTQDQATNADPYSAASPITYASRDTCPTLLLHGENDHQVPYWQAQTFYEQLRRLGVPTRLITVPYGHAFDFLHPATRARIFPEMLAFLNEHLATKK